MVSQAEHFEEFLWQSNTDLHGLVHFVSFICNGVGKEKQVKVSLQNLRFSRHISGICLLQIFFYRAKADCYCDYTLS